MAGKGALEDGTTAHDLDEDKQIKVRIPIAQHIQLHRIRLMEDQSLSETVRRALDWYFDQLPDVEG